MHLKATNPKRGKCLIYTINGIVMIATQFVYAGYCMLLYDKYDEVLMRNVADCHRRRNRMIRRWLLDVDEGNTSNIKC